MDLQIPTIELRPYQLNAWKAFSQGKRRIAMVWPRRAGKDTLSLQMMCAGALERVANYIHMMPYAVTVRKAMWRGINRDGLRFIDVAFPKELRRKTYSSEMLIELRNGSTIQFGGSDNADSLVGGNPAGIVMSELAISNPMAVNLVRPILAENGGWFIAPYTPRGKTFGYEFFLNCQNDPNSFAELLTCDNTGHMSDEALAIERKELDAELFEQEYYCSWNYGAQGAVYARQLSRAWDENRITAVPHDSARPTWAAFDIGFSDATAIWLFQVGPGGQPRILEYYETRGEHPEHFDGWLRAHKYPIRTLFLPHDADQKRIGQKRTVIEQFRDLGHDVRMLPQASVAAGIALGRNMVHKAVFDQDKTELGRSMLGAYKYEKNEKTNTWTSQPVHDYSSHGSDSWRYMAEAIDRGYCSVENWGPVDWSELDRAVI